MGSVAASPARSGALCGRSTGVAPDTARRTLPSTAVSPPRPVRAHASSAAPPGGADPVVVVGAGVGGLVAAAKLAQAGRRVVVLEQRDKVGGRMATETEGGGFRFDTGPSLMLYPDVYRECFAALGTPMEEAFEALRVEDTAYRLFFGDASTLDMKYDVQAMVDQFEGVEPGAGAAFVRFLASARAALAASRPIIEEDAGLAGVARGALPMLGSVNPASLLRQHDAVLRGYFRDPRLRAMFTFQDLYVGLSPYDAPGVYSLLAATELTDGVYYPRGGFGSVTQALVRLCEEAGVEIRTGTAVREILVRPDGGRAGGPAHRVAGVVTSGGETVRAGTVVCNRDLPAAYELVRAEGGGGGEGYYRDAGRELSGKAYSASVMAYYWGVGRALPQLAHHNVFLSEDYRRSWDRARGPGGFVDRPNFYLHNPTVTDPAAAPPGKASLMALLPVADLGQWEGPGGRTGEAEMVAAGRERVLGFLEQHGVSIRDCIEYERVQTPAGWRDAYGLRHGAVFGLAHGLDQLSVNRPAQREPNTRGLYFVGASTRPGNGVPLCMLSGRLVAAKVLGDPS